MTFLEFTQHGLRGAATREGKRCAGARDVLMYVVGGGSSGASRTTPQRRATPYFTRSCDMPARRQTLLLMDVGRSVRTHGRRGQAPHAPY
jgi:hypothetical protein